jgi:hypothetical protein
MKTKSGRQNEYASRDQQFAFSHSLEPIELQQTRGSAPCGCAGDNLSADQFKVIGPVLTARMIQRNNLTCLGVKRSQVAALVLVAQRA